jgi:predicted nucleotidyltransferase
MRGMKDRDFLRTLENFLFCVVGYSHPKDRVVSYLKYVPSSSGKWGKGKTRYARTMPDYTIPNLLQNIAVLGKSHPQYVFTSSVFNIQMSAVPYLNIAERYLPEAKLKALFKMTHPDSLQRTTIELVSHLVSKAKMSRDDFGVTGSILTNIHNPHFSDVDLTVYGQINGWKLKNALTHSLELHSNPGYAERQKRKTLERLIQNYHFTLREAEDIYARRWNYGYFNDRRFSIHPVRTDTEISERYGDRRFFPHRVIEGRAEITDVKESLFLPCKYSVNQFQTLRGKNLELVEEVVSYDGLFTGLFNCGEYISVRGKLEEVADQNGERYFRVLVGSPEAKGYDFIKPLT